MITRRAWLGSALAAGLVRPARADVPITLGLSSNTLAYGGVRIAQEAGLYARNGIALRTIVMDSGNAAVSAVVGGSLQFAAAGPGEALAAKLRNVDLVIVENIYSGLPGSMILSKSAAAKVETKPDGPIEARLRALNGLTIAQPSPTSAYLHPYKAAAESVGARMRYVYMTQAAMVAALQAGAIDGAVLASPFSSTPIDNGTGVLWIDGPRDDLPEQVRPASSACLQTLRTYAGAQPQVVSAMRRVAADLASLIREEPDRAIECLGRAYPSLDPPSLKAVFAENAANWARPAMTRTDIAREIAIQASSGSLPGVASLDPTSVLFP